MGCHAIFADIANWSLRRIMGPSVAKAGAESTREGCEFGLRGIIEKRAACKKKAGKRGLSLNLNAYGHKFSCKQDDKFLNSLRRLHSDFPNSFLASNADRSKEGKEKTGRAM
jgi:hypothetical protein